jgi:PAS domain S-box-containing protein
MEALRTHHAQIAVWAQNCPENFGNRAALVEAEIARLEGRVLDAERLYEEAIRSARTYGFVQNEGLGNELAAQFHAGRGLQTIAEAYLRNARGCYLQWGAGGKVRRLEQIHPHLRSQPERMRSDGTIGTQAGELDLATVLKLSQAVSSEIDLEKSIDALMALSIEHAGAERGLLILPQGDELRIEAEATTGGDRVEVHLRHADVSSAELPESVLRYVVRTRESLLLDDALDQAPFAEDAYVRERRCRSVLCLPLIKQSKLVGVLYLEHIQASHVFTPARVAILRLLASQAAVSLENTRLYRDLEERESRIRRLVDANIMGIVIWTRDGRITEANEAFLDMVGYSRGDLLSGRVRWSDLTAPEWRAADERVRVDLEAAGTVLPYEKEYVRKDGSRVPVLIGATLFEKGGMEGVAFVLDLGAQKRTEEALRRSQAYLAEAQRLTHIGSWAGNILTRQMLHSSEEHTRMYGLDPAAEHSYAEFHDRVHPDDRSRIVEAFENASRAGADVNVQYRIVLPDGAIRYVQAVGHPVSSREPGELAGFLMDVTERRQADEERESLRQAQADLAHVTRVTTMGQLSASIAHEINQPIAAAIINADVASRMLRAPAPDLEEVREALAAIVKDCTRASAVMDRMRALIKKAPPRRDHLEINEAILEVIMLARREIEKNDVTVRTQLGRGLPTVEGDRVQLQQVTLNLIVNAVEAMSMVDGPRDLSISTERADPEGVLVTVRDTGPGLAPASTQRLFETFFTTKAGGLGMGLSICRSIVEAHGGRLWATPNLPRGAVFQFTLPSTSL